MFLDRSGLGRREARPVSPRVQSQSHRASDQSDCTSSPSRSGRAIPRRQAPNSTPRLLALADGLIAHLLTGQLDLATARATLDVQLDRIFGRRSSEVATLTQP